MNAFEPTGCPTFATLLSLRWETAEVKSKLYVAEVFDGQMGGVLGHQNPPMQVDSRSGSAWPVFLPAAAALSWNHETG